MGILRLGGGRVARSHGGNLGGSREEGAPPLASKRRHRHRWWRCSSLRLADPRFLANGIGCVCFAARTQVEKAPGWGGDGMADEP